MKSGSNSRNRTNHANGLMAEELAAAHLRELGFEICQMRFKCREGEIDIVAQNGDLLVFVEVKKRKSFGEDDPISAKQKQRIINAAMQYLSDNAEKSELDMRFDSILIDSANLLNHIKDSWRIEL